MPNTRIRDLWEPIVKSIVAGHPKWGPRRILGELRIRAVEEGLSKDYPSERTVQRIKDDITPEEMIEYSSFHWPESMERGDLPWAASSAALELLGIRHRQNHGRPSIRLTRWFWRVTQAAPNLPLLPIVPPWPAESTDIDPPGRYDIACHLSTWEAGAKAPPWHKAGIEAYLAYAPWRSDLDESYYNSARQAESPQEQIPPVPPLSLDLTAGWEAWSDAFGKDNADKLKEAAEALRKQREEGHDNP